MIEHLPDRLDLLATAEVGRVLKGRLPLVQLPRILSALASSDGELDVEIELGKDMAGFHFLAGKVQGEVALDCQRCLHPVSLPLELQFHLGLVRDAEAASRLPGNYEPLVVTGEPASIADIVSDEVLLALPLVPLHVEDARCKEFVKDYQPPESETRESPFAVLAELKQKEQ